MITSAQVAFPVLKDTVMRWQTLAAALALALWMSGAAHAADTKGNFAIKGAGRVTCADFNRAIAGKSEAALGMVSWLAGYLTAANQYEPRTYDLLAWQDELYLVASVRGYCQKFPKRPLIAVAIGLTQSLRAGRVIADSPVRLFANGNNRVALYADVVRRLQQALATQKLYSGPIDGEASAQLISGIQRFQTSRKLPPSGLPDQQTLYLLLKPAGG